MSKVGLGVSSLKTRATSLAHLVPLGKISTLEAPDGLSGLMPIFDDILIFSIGETRAEALSDDDAKLRGLLGHRCTKGMKLNGEELKLQCTEVRFMGLVICQDSRKPHPG